MASLTPFFSSQPSVPHETLWCPLDSQWLQGVAYKVRRQSVWGTRPSTTYSQCTLKIDIINNLDIFSLVTIILTGFLNYKHQFPIILYLTLIHANLLASTPFLGIMLTPLVSFWVLRSALLVFLKVGGGLWWVVSCISDSLRNVVFKIGFFLWEVAQYW